MRLGRHSVQYIVCLPFIKDTPPLAPYAYLGDRDMPRINIYWIRSNNK